MDEIELRLIDRRLARRQGDFCGRRRLIMRRGRKKRRGRSDL